MGIFDQFYEKIRNLLGEEEGKPLKKRDYYELLEVTHASTDDEIKKSYRKLALKWHPDKNPGKEEECAAYFTVLQQAYEVLSDPRERAFYDKHKDNILRDQDAAEEKRDEGLKLFQYFQPCYRGFGDDADGFYTIYRELFDKLATEEYPYLDEDEDRNFPTFGRSDSDYDMVVGPFYDFWTSFSTARSFAWLDKWNLRDAPDRGTLRAMEKENKKERESGKNERNDEIRQLALFIRKRDKRVKAFRDVLEQRKKEAQARAEEKRRQMIRENLEKLEEHVEDEETTAGHLKALEEIEDELDAQFGTARDTDDSDAEGQVESKYCVACEKSFKTSKSYMNHQKSKKHKQQVELLKKFMVEEDHVLLQDEVEEEVEEKPQRSKKKKRRGKQSLILVDEAEKEDEPETTADTLADQIGDVKIDKDEEAANSEPDRKDKKKAKKKSKLAPEPVVKKPEGPTVPVPSECKVCGIEFESRSKLFRHVEVSGHAALKDTNQKGKKNGKK